MIPHSATCLAIAVLGVSSAGCQRVQQAPAAASLRLAGATAPAVAMAAASTSTGFLAVVVAPSTVDVASQLEARLQQVRVRAGDHVAKGEVIALLDTRAADLELAMARAALLSAEAQLRRAQLELAEAGEKLERRSNTVELPTGGTAGTVSDEELSSADYQEKLGRVAVAAAQAAVLDKRAHFDELRALASEGAVRAPFDGVIAQRYVDPGSIVHKGAPIVRLLESVALRVRFAMSEQEARLVDVGVPVRVDVDGIQLAGTVEKIAPEIDAAARMIFADASLEVPDADHGHVRSGQVARVYPVAPEHASP